MYCFLRRYVPFALGLLASWSAAAQSNNLLVNGDFQAGNPPNPADYGFTSDYPHAPQTFGWQVVHNPNTDWFGGFASFNDHTTNSPQVGWMLAVDGATVPKKVVWQATFQAPVANTYIFTGWSASMGHLGNFIDPAPARLEFLANGTVFGIADVNPSNGIWTSFQMQVALQPGPVTLQVIDLTTAGCCNNFALDDLSIAVVPEPETYALLLAGLGVLGVGVRRTRAAR